MSVRVVARIRPLLDKDKELSKDIIVRAEGDEGKKNVVRIPNPKNESEEFSFTFNGVYDMSTSQEELFTNEGILLGKIQDLYLLELIRPQSHRISSLSFRALMLQSLHMELRAQGRRIQ